MKLKVFVIALVALCVIISSSVSAEEKKGGIVPGLASCCLIGVPGGQIQNSGVSIPGRSWARILVIPMIIDGFKAYNGETAEEYLGVKKLPTTTKGKGGVGNGLISCCCWVGLPAGHLMNSGKTIPARSFLKLIPYVGSAVSVYDGFQAYQGETISEYAEIK